MINYLLIASNPFLDSYIQSDLLGKLIFIALLLLSIASWIMIVYKVWLTRKSQKNSMEFKKIFESQKLTPLNLESHESTAALNPFRSIYAILKQKTLELLSKNRHFAKASKEASFLSPNDVDYVDGYLMTTITSETKFLEKNLFILATVVSLGPFLGLLGTVWGILSTFSAMTAGASGNTHQAVLSGLSLALATTVLGLIDAIPALIGYNYLKNRIREFEMEMENFAHEALSCVEIQYRKVD